MSVVTFTYNPEPQPACYPSDVNGLAQLLTQGGMLAGTVPDQAGGGIFVGSAPPSSSLTYKVWFKIDGAGRPLGSYQFYNGNWRKVYTNVGIGDVKLYFGSGANFDSTGRGIVGADTDGWAICNGNNGTPNMSDGRFASGGSWNGSQWTGGGGGVSTRGGSNNHQIAASDLPSLHVGAYSWPLDAQGGTGTHIESMSFPGAGGPTHLFGTWNVNETQNSPNNALPPPKYQTFAYIMFVGYT